LIAQMLDVSDIISDQGQLSCLKLASTLSNALESFYSNCRIWGEVKTQTPKLAQARLGLVAITQGLLRSLLQEKLGVPAPVEL
jgi:arginyl-tRNA synthetase